MSSEKERSTAPFLFRFLLLLAAAASVCLLPWGAAIARQEPDAPFLPDVQGRDPAVPTFEQALGYAPGDRLTPPADALGYLQALQRSSPRVTVHPYGTTLEGRTLAIAAIADPDLIARLDDIRAGSRRLADTRGLSPAAIEELVARQPVIAWIGAGVHGSEASSAEAVLALAYHLASARDERTEAMLREVVVVIDPAQNPDGRERFVQYQRQVGADAARTDSYAADHDEPWPGGRFNHRLFDLNRDWFFQTQPETRARVAAFLEWMPQVYVDLHEMSEESTYYFAPPAEPVNRNVPLQIRRWWEVFGQSNASAFDRERIDYYTAETFDGYYPGYGDSWPSLHGAVGMTYEQASPRGSAIRRKDGTVLTLREAARHHFIAALSTVETAASHRAGILRDYAASRRDAGSSTGSGEARAYLIPPTVPATAGRLVGLLQRQGIEVSRAKEDFSARAHPYDGSGPQSHRFPAGTWVVPVAQPAGRLVTALMEMDPALSEDFVQQEMERRRLKQDSGIYDVTAWSLPLMQGAEAWWAPDLPRVPLEEAPPAEPPLPGAIVPLSTGGDRGSAARQETSRAGAPVYAYLVKYDSNPAARVLISLLREGFRVHAAGRPFRVGGESFPAGSLVVRTRGNPGSLADMMRREARAGGVDVYAVSSGLTDEGIDLGSANVRAVTMPSVAVAWGEPVSPTSVGAILHMFEGVYGLPCTPVRTATLSAADLSRYSVLILPDEDGQPGYAAYFTGESLAALTRWVEAGGTLVTVGRATAFAVRKETGLTTTRRVMKPGRPEADSRQGPGRTEAPPEESPEPPDRVPGAILRVLIEPTRPPAFGYGREGAVLMNSNLVLDAGPEARVAASFAPRERLRLAGFIYPESQDLLAGSPYLVEESRGRGRVLLFADDPNFRGAWEALHRMFLNGILLSPAFGG